MSSPRALKILSYEDSAAGALLLQIAIDECGLECEFTACRSQSEAARWLNEGTFSMLLTNFGRDHDDAVRFLNTVRKLHPRVVIVVFSASQDAGMAYEAGCHAFIPHSIAWTTFAEQVKGILHFYGRIAELPATELLLDLYRTRHPQKGAAVNAFSAMARSN